MTKNLPAQHVARVSAFLETKVRAARGRLIFALDATFSRQDTWDTACHLQGEMFAEVAKIGGMEVQLVFYRGDECKHSHWTFNAHELANAMRQIKCNGGVTQIGKVLDHIRAEHQRQKLSAAVFVGDAMEEKAGTLYDVAAAVGVPIFLFQEGDDPDVKLVFKKIASLTHGAYSQFTPGSAHELGELLRAVAAFAVGGLTALTDQHSSAARKLLEQLK
jgi:hypothetical protein